LPQNNQLRLQKGIIDMIRRQSIRIFAYFAIATLTAAMSGILWPSGGSIVSVAAGAQESLWREITPDSLDALARNSQSQVAPRHYKAFQLNEAALTPLLAGAPMEFTEAAKDSRNEITLPMPDGSIARFRFVESPIMEPELAARFPKIKTYQGWGIDDPAAMTRFGRTGAGFHAIVLSPKGSSYVTPLFRGEKSAYASYFMSDLRDAGGDDGAWRQVGPGVRATDRPGRDSFRQSARLNSFSSNGATKRTFQLAVAATGEYTNFHGGTVEGAMDAISTTINNVNAIYQNELAVRFILIGANDSIIYTDSATDPYANGTLEELVDENQENLDSTLGEGNYDIGHVFTWNLIGISGYAPGKACDDGDNARAVTASLEPENRQFDLRVAHEFGHQLGASHTFNGVSGGCADEVRDDDTAYEPGSGSTLMAIPGMCDSDNIQGPSDSYFHGASLAEIARFLDECADCATSSFNNNTPPNVTPPTPTFPTPLGHYLIPKQTPFSLTASATDAEDPSTITYCWEELDNGSPGPPSGDRGDNPLFRSWPPSPNPTRFFPKMSDALGNTTTIGETLPTTFRSMAFRVTARDNHPSGGGFDQADVVVDVWTAAGPFVVTEPAAGAEALEGRPLIVRWDVAGTDGQAIKATRVRILLSADDGESFQITLAADTQNDGEFSFTVPRANTQKARIKVEAIDNIFFNVSPAFTIIPKPTIIATGSLEVYSGGEATAKVATVADERDAADSLIVETTTRPLPTGVTLSFTKDDGVISATATVDCISFVGSRQIRLQVTNSAGLTASTTFNLTVGQNQPPTLGDYSNAIVVAGQTIVVSPSAPPADPNGNLSAVTVSPLILPGGSGTLSVDEDTGSVTIPTRRVTQLGIRHIRVRVTDSCGSEVVSDLFLDIINSPPEVTPNGSSVHTMQGGSSLAPVEIATISDGQDLSGDLEVSANAPAGLGVEVANSSGAIMATATSACAVAPGSYNATLTVKDSAGGTATGTFQIVVDPNPPPILGNYNNTGVTIGGSVLIVPTVPPSDPNNAISLSVFPGFLPNGGLITINQTIGPNYGRVTATPGPNTPVGKYPVQVTAVDACGVTTTRSFELTVRSAACPTEQRFTYVADTDNHRIQRFNGASWIVVGSGSGGSGPGQFNSPEAVVANGIGQMIYVADTGNNRIQWSQNGGASWAVFAGNLTPRGLALDRDGNLYVSDAQDGRVIRYPGGLPGTPILLATSGSGAGQVSNPNGLAIDCRMNLYIADTGNNRILRIETADAAVIPNTGTVVAGSGAGLNPAQVTAPQGVAVDDSGDLYVADTGNNRVLLITTAPAPGAGGTLCMLGTQLGQVDSPEGVTVAAYTIGPLAGMSTLVVSDTNNDRIEGARLPIIAWVLLPAPTGGGPGSGMGQFKRPSKIR
jgi:sugar lactone lactonase YvrE